MKNCDEKKEAAGSRWRDRQERGEGRKNKDRGRIERTLKKRVKEKGIKTVRERERQVER